MFGEGIRRENEPAVGGDELIPGNVARPGPFEQDVRAGRPAEQMGRAVRVVLEQEVADGMLLAAGGSGNTFVGEGGKSLAVTSGTVTPDGFGESVQVAACGFAPSRKRVALQYGQGAAGNAPHPAPASTRGPRRCTLRG